jgi:hypothetical protein
MKPSLLLLIIVAVFSLAPVNAQVPPSPSVPSTEVDANHAILAGRWTYRSFHNDPAFVGEDPNKALI